MTDKIQEIRRRLEDAQGNGSALMDIQANAEEFIRDLLEHIREQDAEIGRLSRIISGRESSDD